MTSIADTLGWTDLLSKHSMKPLIETVRSATVSAMILSSGFLFLAQPNIGLSCIQVNRNESEHYSVPQAQFVGKVCGLQTPWILRNLPWITALTTGFVFIANNLWLYCPGVGAAILRFAAAYDLHNELHAALPSLEIAVTTPNKQDTSEDGMKRRNKLRKFCSLLRWFMRGTNSSSDFCSSCEMKCLTCNSKTTSLVVRDFAKAFQLRNLLSMIVAVGFLVVHILPLLPIPWVGLPKFPPNTVFECGISKQFRATYVCTYGSMDAISLAIFVFLLCLFEQIWIFVCFLYSYAKLNDLVVLRSFAEKSSEKETWATFEDWIGKLEKEPGDMSEQAKTNFSVAIENKDIDFFHFIYKTFGADEEQIKTEFEIHTETPGYNDMRPMFEKMFTAPCNRA